MGRPSNRAEEVDEPLIVEDRVKAEEMELAYKDVDEAEPSSPKALVVGMRDVSRVGIIAERLVSKTNEAVRIGSLPGSVWRRMRLTMVIVG